MAQSNEIPNENEIKIQRCILSKNDIEMMFVDRALSVGDLADELGYGIKKTNKLLARLGINKSWYEREITPRRLRVLKYIAYHQNKYNASPSVKEIAKNLAIPSCTVVYHINILKEFGYVDKQKYKKEIVVTEKGKVWCKNVDTFGVSLLVKD